ncbi:MAG: hypothetical protein RR942_05620 [Romboutsia sp.]
MSYFTIQGYHYVKIVGVEIISFYDILSIEGSIKNQVQIEYGLEV